MSVRKILKLQEFIDCYEGIRTEVKKYNEISDYFERVAPYEIKLLLEKLENTKTTLFSNVNDKNNILNDLKQSRLGFLFENDSFVTIDKIKEKFSNQKLNGSKYILIFKGKTSSIPTLFVASIKMNKSNVLNYLKGHFEMGTIFEGVKYIFLLFW